jgi:hypothetical protein
MMGITIEFRLDGRKLPANVLESHKCEIADVLQVRGAGVLSFSWISYFRTE